MLVRRGQLEQARRHGRVFFFFFLLKQHGRALKLLALYQSTSVHSANSRRSRARKLMQSTIPGTFLCLSDQVSSEGDMHATGLVLLWSLSPVLFQGRGHACIYILLRESRGMQAGTVLVGCCWESDGRLHPTRE